MSSEIADVAYAAGILDGEGSITVLLRGRGPGRGVVRVTVSNTDTRLIDWFINRYGGSRSQIRKTEGKRRACYQWEVFSHSAIAFLQVVRPYLVIKGNQADMAIAYQKTIPSPGTYSRWNKVPPLVLAQRKQLERRLREAKRIEYT